MLNEQRSKILVVDDDPSNRRKVCKDLATANYWAVDTNRLEDTSSVWETDDKNIPSVHRLVNSHFFHAAVVDLSLKPFDSQDRSGFEVLKSLNKFRESTKSIVLTGYGIAHDVRSVWKELGAFDWLEKDDYSPEKLLGMIEGAVKEARLRVNSTMGSNLIYGTLVGNPNLADVQEKLKVGGGEVIRSIVEEALRPWYPYDTRYKTSAFDVLYINETPHTILVVKLWSRYLGGCIEMRLGSREACRFLVEVNKRVSEKEGEDFIEYVLDPNDKLSAVVEYNPSIRLDELRDIRASTE